MKLLLVTWLDPASHHIGWADIATIKAQKPHTVLSVGYEAHREGSIPNGWLTLVASEVDDGDCSGDVTIPLGCILEERELS